MTTITSTPATDRGRETGVVRLKQLLDDLTGRVTMYRLVLLCLVGMAVAAVLLSLTNHLTYSVGAIVLSAAVLTGVTYAGNRIFAGLYRVRPHTESTFITAGLLFFIFQPSTDTKALAAMAVAALVASASKYLLAIRGRHIFNPAAIGAVWVSVFSIGYAGWWVANPILVWLTLALALLVLYRSRRLPLGAIFVALALVIIVGRAMIDGADFADAFRSAFNSYPILFFAGFMLSEPLTLPPLRWQQYSVAVVVALLFSVPINIGSVFIGPEYALVIGNLLAFGFGQRRRIEMVLQGRTQLTPTTFEFAFKPARPIRFRAGQYLELTVPHPGADARGSRRVFSIASAPHPDEPIRVAVRIPQRSSSFKRALGGLRDGETVSATSVGGDFVLSRTARVPLLMIAGGIGITPFLSQLQHRAAGPGNQDVVLLYAASSTAELSYAAELERTGARVVVVGPPTPQGLPRSWSWAGSGRLDGALIAAAVPDVDRRRVLVSGPPAMVNGVKAALRGLGVRRVKADYFSGY